MDLLSYLRHKNKGKKDTMEGKVYGAGNQDN